MSENYNIPLHYKKGVFGVNELKSASEEECILLSLGEYDVLSYPLYGRENRIYSVTKDAANNTMQAAYDDKGNIRRIDVETDGKRRLVFINFCDAEAAKQELSDFMQLSARRMCSETIAASKKEKFARLFIERFYDGEAADIAIRPGSEKYAKYILESSGGNAEDLDFSGEYPIIDRIECDINMLGTLLCCARPEVRNDLFNFAVDILRKKIEEDVLDVIEKTDDFKFIVDEYD